MCPSNRPGWSETGILHVGVMIGNDRKTARKRRKSFDDLDECFFWEGWWREIVGRGGESSLGDVGVDVDVDCRSSAAEVGVRGDGDRGGVEAAIEKWRRRSGGGEEGLNLLGILKKK
ncbi:hypothetical protein M5689_020204 [Euphorbia peplus]|nr:hypothetical protein M5689_020204 [Euphorbia peplus]